MAEGPGFKFPQQSLESSDVAPIRVGGGGEGQAVNIRDHKTPRYPEVEGCDLEEKEKGGDWRTLGGADINWGWGPWGPLRDWSAAPLT